MIKRRRNDPQSILCSSIDSVHPLDVRDCSNSLGDDVKKRVEQIGDCTLYLGDCLEILPTFDADSVRMIWTDPPYGHSNNDGDLNAALSTGAIDGRAYRSPVSIQNDGMDEMRSVVGGMLDEAARILKKDCCCCCCCGGGGPSPTFAWVAQRMDSRGLSFFHSVIWDKINIGLGWRYRRQHEMVMVAHKQGGKLAWNKNEEAIGNIISISAPQGSRREHPNEKPLRLIQLFIQKHTYAGDFVLDPFMGSGTTGVACVNLGRKFIGIEIEPKYFDIACKRIDAASRQEKLFKPEPKESTVDMDFS